MPKNVKILYILIPILAVFSFPSGLIVGIVLTLLAASPDPDIGSHFRFYPADQYGVFIQKKEDFLFNPIVGNWFLWVREHDGIVIGQVPDRDSLESPFVRDHIQAVSDSGYFILNSQSGAYKIGLSQTEFQNEFDKLALKRAKFEWVQILYQDNYRE